MISLMKKKKHIIIANQGSYSLKWKYDQKATAKRETRNKQKMDTKKKPKDPNIFTVLVTINDNNMNIIFLNGSYLPMLTRIHNIVLGNCIREVMNVTGCWPNIFFFFFTCSSCLEIMLMDSRNSLRAREKLHQFIVRNDPYHFQYSNKAVT